MPEVVMSFTKADVEQILKERCQRSFKSIGTVKNAELRYSIVKGDPSDPREPSNDLVVISAAVTFDSSETT